eukprot:TRINITY_DN4267_c0_g1_i1.p1 TRINITY_DN4267_c0_g1~~TRINITY_DN4267_c0_g1_i1.p1  ORF type:complete len:162 (+),score=28.41 TRINITY_DN4267_c0_g1_i1:49-534(+)
MGKSDFKDPSKLGITQVSHVDGPCLKIYIYRAKNLVAADKNGLSDPYVDIRCGGWRTKTRVIRKTLNPKWNTFVIFPIEHPKGYINTDEDLINFQIYDKDSLGKQKIGNYDLHLNRLNDDGSEFKKTAKLRDVETGTLTFGIEKCNSFDNEAEHVFTSSSE